VLLGNLDPIVRFGLVRALAEGGIEVIGDEHDGEAMMLTAGQAHPDAIILGGDHPRAAALGELLQEALPGTKVIFFDRDEANSRVLDPRTKVTRPMRSPVIEALVAELSPTPRNTEESNA
jgi:DNA-binding NarL/FixJ family response regulator